MEPSGARIVALPLARIDDAELLAQLNEGRPAAYRELFDRFSRFVRSVLVRTLGVDVDTDDLVQETFLVIVQRSATIRDPSALRSFVYSVALRIARNELRKRALRRWIPWEESSSSVPVVPAHDPVIRNAIERIYAVLDRLSPDLRITFVLRYVEGHELTEAAALSGTSLATFKRRLARAAARFDLIAGKDPVLAQWLEQRGRS